MAFATSQGGKGGEMVWAFLGSLKKTSWQRPSESNLFVRSNEAEKNASSFVQLHKETLKA